MTTSDVSMNETKIQNFLKSHFDETLNWPFALKKPAKSYGPRCYSVSLKNPPKTYRDHLKLIEKLYDSPIDDLEVILKKSEFSKRMMNLIYFRNLQ